MYTNGNHQARIELPVATRHRRDMTGKLLKAALNQSTQFSDAFPLNSNDLDCIKNGNHQTALYKVPP